MRVRSVRVERLKNLGNYETLRVALEADLGPSEKAPAVLRQLDNQARAYLRQDSVEEEERKAARAAAEQAARAALEPAAEAYKRLRQRILDLQQQEYACRGAVSDARRAAREGRTADMHADLRRALQRRCEATALLAEVAAARLAVSSVEAQPAVIAARQLLDAYPPALPIAPDLPEIPTPGQLLFPAAPQAQAQEEVTSCP